MNREQFHKFFSSAGPVVLPVIHVLDETQTLVNIEIALNEGALGVFLINHDFGPEQLLPIINAARGRFPSLWIGVNFLGVTLQGAAPQLGELARSGTTIDGYWADDARIDEREAHQTEADNIANARRNHWPEGLYFGGTAFKKQRPVTPDNYQAAAGIARNYMDVVTTSGPATGQEADADKISTFRQSVGDCPLALASGITPENAYTYRDVDCFMVATGINRSNDFYNIDPIRLADLLEICRTIGREQNQRDEG